MSRRFAGLVLVVAVAGCSRSFKAPEVRTAAGPTLTLAPLTIVGRPGPAVAKDGDVLDIEATSNQTLIDCVATVGGQSASCTTSQSACRCTLTVGAGLPEAALAVTVKGTSANGSDSRDEVVQIDRTPPVVNLDLLKITRAPLGSDDQVSGLPGAVVDEPDSGYPGQQVTELDFYPSFTSDQVLRTVVPNPDGSFPAGALASIGGGLAAPELWVAARDLPGNVHERVRWDAESETSGPDSDGGGLQIVRNGLGVDDAVLADPGAFSRQKCEVAAVSVYAQASGGAPLGVLDGGVGQLALDGTTVRSYQELWASAVDKCGLPGPRVAIVRGADFDGPIPDAGALGIARNPLGTPDQLRIGAGGVVDDVSAVAQVRVFGGDDGGQELQDGGFSLAQDGSLALDVGDGAHAPRQVWISAIDKCGNEGPRVAVVNGADLDGPVPDAGAMSLTRNALGTPDQLQAHAGSFVDAVSALAQVRVFASADGSVELDDGGLVPAADGSLTFDVGDGTSAPAQLWVSAVDKCGNEGARVEVPGGDLSAPVINAAALTWMRRPHGSADGLAGATGAISDSSAIREVRAYDGAAPDAGLLATFTVDATGGFAEQALADATASPRPQRIWVEATDKAGNVSGRDYARQVQATLNLAGRAPYDDGVSPISFYAFGSSFDVRTLPAGPGVAPSLSAEVADAGGAAAADGASFTTIASTAAATQVAFTRTRPGDFIATQQGMAGWQYAPWQAMYFDAAHGTPVLLEAEPVRVTEGASPVLGAWVRAGTTWRGVPVASGPDASQGVGYAVTWDPDLDAGLLVECSGGNLLSWSFDGTSWAFLAIGSVPCDVNAVAVAYDKGASQPVLVTRAYPYFNVVTYALQSGTWTALNTPTTPASDIYTGSPLALALTYDDAQQELVLFTSAAPTTDGQGNAVAQNTWTFNAGDWHCVAASSFPSQRSDVGMYFDSALQRVVLLGGMSDNMGTALGDTWTFTGSTWETAASALTSPRYGVAAAYDTSQGRALLAGGGVGFNSLGMLASLYRDTWTYDGASITNVDPPTPAARFDQAMSFDGATGQTVVFGGYDPGQGILYGDTWAFDGARWTVLATGDAEASPGPRYGQVMTYDSRRGRLVLFGGANASGLFQDTWSFDGAHWTRLTTAHSPPARYEHALAYDAARDRVILFGGWTGGFFFSDTWEFDGNDWTQVVTARSPAGRHGHGLAYDARRGKVVLFGGTTALNDVGDLWEYDGATWTLVSSSPTLVTSNTGWTERSEMNLAWLPTWAPSANGGPGPILMFGGRVLVNQGGFSSGEEPGDGYPWYLDQQVWTSFGLYGPPPRTQAGLAYDFNRDQSLIFGGLETPSTGISSADPFEGQRPGDDAWLLTGGSAHSVTATHVAAVALPAGIALQQLSATYVGAGSGDLNPDGGAAVPGAGVDLFAWSARDGGAWVALGSELDGGAVEVTPAADLDGGCGSYLTGDRVWLMAAAPPSSAPGAAAGVESRLDTDYLEVRAVYVLPGPDGG